MTRLRPRYSLLTLLILTALIAGGVKLWYGPHHVVERQEPFQEFDYTFTRDWQGNRVLHGFCICRSIDPSLLNASFILILCYRQGVALEWQSCYSLIPNSQEPPTKVDTSIMIDGELVTFEEEKVTAETLLTPAEFAEYQQILEQQKQHLHLTGYKPHVYEHQEGFGETDIEKIKKRLGLPFSFDFK